MANHLRVIPHELLSFGLIYNSANGGHYNVIDNNSILHYIETMGWNQRSSTTIHSLSLFSTVFCMPLGRKLTIWHYKIYNL